MADKTMINSPTFGRFAFDAVLSVSHNANVTVTEHPVQTGSSVADHAFMTPDEVQLEVGMTDVGTGIGSPGTNHSVNAYTRLRAIMELCEPFTLTTRLKTYHNMLIVSMSVPDDYTTMNALKVSIVCKKVNIVSVSTVKVQQTVSASKTTSQSGSSGGSTNATTKKATTSSTTQKKTSAAKQLANTLIAAAKTSSTVVTTKVAVKPSAATTKKAVGAASMFRTVALVK